MLFLKEILTVLVYFVARSSTTTNETLGITLCSSNNISITNSGRTCQAWGHQRPHRHRFSDSSYFTVDGSIEAAENFCRPLDNEERPWCYTTDIYRRWDYCHKVVCYEGYDPKTSMRKRRFSPPLYYYEEEPTTELSQEKTSPMVVETRTEPDIGNAENENSTLEDEHNEDPTPIPIDRRLNLTDSGARRMFLSNLQLLLCVFVHVGKSQLIL